MFEFQNLKLNKRTKAFSANKTHEKLFNIRVTCEIDRVDWLLTKWNEMERCVTIPGNEHGFTYIIQPVRFYMHIGDVKFVYTWKWSGNSSFWKRINVASRMPAQKRQNKKKEEKMRNYWPFFSNVVTVNVYAFGNKMSKFRFRLILLCVLFCFALQWSTSRLKLVIPMQWREKNPPQPSYMRYHEHEHYKIGHTNHLHPFRNWVALKEQMVSKQKLKEMCRKNTGE